MRNLCATIIILMAFMAGMPDTLLAGSIEGQVVYKGKPRPPKKLKMAEDGSCRSGLTTDIFDEKFVHGEPEGGLYPLANIFVYIKSGLPERTYPIPEEPVLVDQENCRFVPHVIGVRTGQEVQFRNSDPTMHNVHLLAKNSPPFNRGMPAGSPDLSYRFNKSEVMAKIKCDAHPWMAVFVGIVDHPFFAVTGSDGRFAIEGLPDGDYEIETWQELLKTRTAEVSVRNGTGTLDIVYERNRN